MARVGKILFLIDLIFGLYFLNSGMNLIPLSFLSPINNLINILGGILLIIGGIFALRGFSYRIVR